MCSFCSYKCCFIFFNFLFLVSGVALIIIGVKEHSTYLLLGTFAMQSLSKITIVLIAVGVAITLVSLLGHLGAFFNVKTMVSCFVCILIIVIILEVLTGAVFYLVGKRVRRLNTETVLLKLKDSINGKTLNVMHDFTPEKRCALEEIQEKFKCCGTFGPGDWSTTVGWENHEAVPDSCCVVKTEHCGQNMTNIHSKGCVKNIAVFMMKNLLWVAIVCVVLGISEVFGVLVGVCFRMNMKQKSYENMS